MSVGSEFHRSDAATGKKRRPTVVSRNGGTSSCCDSEERSRLRPGRAHCLAADNPHDHCPGRL